MPELFNGNIKVTLDDADRIAVGQPGIPDSDNIRFDDFVEQINGSNVESGTFDNGDLSGNIWTYVHGKGTSIVEVSIYNGSGELLDLGGILTVTGPNEVEIDFGGTITGTYTYIFKYYN